MSVVDQSRDPVMAHLMRRVADRPKLAAAAMDVDVNADALATLPDSAFAWPEKRAYPIHDPGHALLSRIYREDVANVPAHVDVALKQACEVYGIDDAVFARPKVASAPVRDPDGDYLLPDIRRLRVTTKESVKEAEERLRVEGYKLSPGHRVLASARLVEKAAALGVPLRAETLKLAGLVATDTRALADWVDARSEAAAPEHKDGYRKLAAAVRGLPSELHDRDTQLKIATTLEELDALSGVSMWHGRRIPDPAATVFNTTKTANWNAGGGVTLAGKFMPLERLAAYLPSFYSDVLGQDIVREASDASGQMDHAKLAQILETLPVDMQRVLASQMR